MTDTDSDIEDVETNKVLTRLIKPLFKSSLKHVSANDAQAKRWAVTVNIQPTKLMNKRQWRKYSPDQQMAILGRIEAAFRRKTPSVLLIELHYETCPVLGNIHFHALYSMPSDFVTTMENYYKDVCDSSDEKTLVKWRYLDVQEVKDEKSWIEYIRKDVNK